MIKHDFGLNILIRTKKCYLIKQDEYIDVYIDLIIEINFI